jgi:hypothetical protein
MDPEVASVRSVVATKGAFVRSTVASVMHPVTRPHMRMALHNLAMDRQFFRFGLSSRIIFLDPLLEDKGEHGLWNNSELKLNP